MHEESAVKQAMTDNMHGNDESFMGLPPKTVATAAAPAQSLFFRHRYFFLFACVTLSGIAIAIDRVSAARSAHDLAAALGDRTDNTGEGSSELPSQPTSSMIPSTVPSITSSSHVSTQPSATPSSHPSRKPSIPPSAYPSMLPTIDPTLSSSHTPSHIPTNQPSVFPSQTPSHMPSRTPLRSPSQQPTESPSSTPSARPSHNPTVSPSTIPTNHPTSSPTTSPFKHPTRKPIQAPTHIPSSPPTQHPSTRSPTKLPSKVPTKLPSKVPTKSVVVSNAPTVSPPIICPEGWRFARTTLYNSWPKDEEECIDFEGCKWAGLFSDLNAGWNGNCNAGAELLNGGHPTEPDVRCRFSESLVGQWSIAATYGNDLELRGRKVRILLNSNAAICEGVNTCTVDVNIVDYCGIESCADKVTVAPVLIDLEAQTACRMFGIDYQAEGFTVRDAAFSVPHYMCFKDVGAADALP